MTLKFIFVYDIFKKQIDITHMIYE